MPLAARLLRADSLTPTNSTGVPSPIQPLYSTTDSLTFGLLVLLLAWAPLPFGSVTPSGNTCLVAGAGVLFGLSSLSRVRPLPAHVLLPTVPLVLLGGLALLQLAPLPTSWVGWLSPEALRIWREADRILLASGAGAPTPRLSLAPAETGRALLLLAAYIALFVAAVRLCATRARRFIVTIIPLGGALFQIVYGGVLATRRSEMILGMSTGIPAERLRGTFIDPDHLAVYLSLALTGAFGLLLAELTGGHGSRTGSSGDRLLPIGWRAVLWMTVYAGVWMTRSRAGIVAATVTALSLGLLAAVRVARRRAARRTAVASLGVLLVGGALLLLGPGSLRPAIVRFLTPTTDRELGVRNARVRGWAAALRVADRFPAVGVGFGAFREGIQLEQERELPGRWDHAHNDWVELRTTAGLTGLLLGLAALAGAAGVLLRLWLSQPHRVESALALAALGALFSMNLHALADFPFAIPALPATLAIILGCGAAAGSDRSPRAGAASQARPAHQRDGRPESAAPAPAGAGEG